MSISRLSNKPQIGTLVIRKDTGCSERNPDPVTFQVYVPYNAKPLEKSIHNYLGKKSILPIDLASSLHKVNSQLFRQ